MRRFSFRPRLLTLIYVVSGVARFPAESCAAELTRWAATRLSEAKAHMLHIAREGGRDLYISGYVRQWFTQPIASSVSLGAGYTVALSTRSDGWYIPFPIILPLATVRFSRFSLMTTGLPRIPGAVNIKGSVVFVWGRYEL